MYKVLDVRETDTKIIMILDNQGYARQRIQISDEIQSKGDYKLIVKGDLIEIYGDGNGGYDFRIISKL